ncbi:MAG: enoyl-CoA hydratase-related protein [Bacteroidota bacterium]
MYEFLKYSSENGIARMTLSRADAYNSLNDGITFEIQDVIKKVAKDQDVRVLIISGEGKAFCAGQDLKESSKQEKKSFSESLHKRYNPIIKGIRNMPKPVICQLNGVAAGAGCSLALVCDIIVASDKSYLMEVFVNIGLVLDSGSSYFLPRLVGYTKAFEWSTMSTKVSAEEAEKWGIVTKVVPAEELESSVNEYAEHYAKAPTKAIGLMKKMLNKSYGSSLDDMLEYEAWCQEIAGGSDDYKEGVQAFLDKRKPEFKGK